MIRLDDCTNILQDILSLLSPTEEAKVLPKGYVYSDNLFLPPLDLARKVEKQYLNKLPVKIEKGERHDTFIAYAGVLHACGFPTDDIKKRLIRFDKERTIEPKNDDEEILKVIDWVQQKAPGFHSRIKISELLPVIDNPEELKQRAIEIWKSGRFIPHIIKTFDKYWCGDSQIALWVILQHVNGLLNNPDIGIHLHITGPSGAGKSDSVKAALKLIPPEKTIVGSFTKKGIIYLMTSLEPGSTILHDDHVADEDEMELNRAILSGWLNGYRYFSVEDGKTKEIHIPDRVSRIITNTESLSHEFSCGQDESRFVQIEIYRNEEFARNIIEFIQEQHPTPDDDIKICHIILRMIAEQKFTVVIPKINKHDVIDPKQIRRFKQELTIQKCVTVLNGRVNATGEDITKSNEYMGYTLRMLSPELPGLGRNEKYLYDVIYKHFVNPANKSALRIPDLQTKTNGGLTSARFYEALRGDSGTFENPTGGILRKVPGLHVRSAMEKDHNGNDRVLNVKELFFSGTVKPY